HVGWVGRIYHHGKVMPYYRLDSRSFPGGVGTLGHILPYCLDRTRPVIASELTVTVNDHLLSFRGVTGDSGFRACCGFFRSFRIALNSGDLCCESVSYLVYTVSNNSCVFLTNP